MQGSPSVQRSTREASVNRTAGIVLYTIDARDRDKHDWHIGIVKATREKRRQKGEKIMETEEWKVPTNDEKAERMLSEGRDKPISSNLIGIYQCERATGATISEALKVALKAHIDAYERAQQDCNKSTDEPAERTWWAGYEYIDARQTQE